MKRGFCAIVCIMISISLSGCWSRKEPKTLALVNSSLYDFSDIGDFQVTIEVLNPAALGGINDSGGGKSPNITVISEGGSIPVAIRNASESLERTIFGGHNKVRFFSEKFAETDMISIMDYWTRDHLTDENPLMVVVKGEDPKQVYSCMLGLSDTVGDYLESMSKTQPYTTANSVFVKNLDFIKDYYEEGKQPVAGVVELVECGSKPSNNTATDFRNSQGSQSPQDSSNKEYKIKYEGLAAFKDGKLVGYMEAAETRAYNFVINNVENAAVSISSEDKQTVVTVHNPKAEIKTEINDGQITANVKIKTSMSIVQESGILDISKMDPLKTVEADFDKQMEEEIIATIKKAQTEFHSDIFGFGESVHKQHPEKWKEIKEDWGDYFAGASINVSVESSVDRSGEIKQPFKLED